MDTTGLNAASQPVFGRALAQLLVCLSDRVPGRHLDRTGTSKPLARTEPSHHDALDGIVHFGAGSKFEVRTDLAVLILVLLKQQVNAKVRGSQ